MFLMPKSQIVDMKQIDSQQRKLEDLKMFLAALVILQQLQLKNWRHMEAKQRINVHVVLYALNARKTTVVGS